MEIPSMNARDHETFIDTVLDHVADPIFVKDRRHRWVYLNKAYCEFMGHASGELLGKTDRDFFPKAEADVFWEKDEVVFRTAQENVNEEKFTDSKGATHTIITKKALLKTATGEEFIVGVIRDVTDLKRVEKTLCDKMRELEIFNKAAVDRELTMVELKRKVQKLETQVKNTPGL
ncbi:MAG: PAS domain S-box protein [Candidatus Omnitrophota bacterium]